MNDKINIKEFVFKVLEAVNIHAKSAIESNSELFRKVAKLLKMKKISLFEAFLYMDINNTGQLSKLELTVGFCKKSPFFPYFVYIFPLFLNREPIDSSE